MLKIDFLDKKLCLTLNNTKLNANQTSFLAKTNQRTNKVVVCKEKRNSITIVIFKNRARKFCFSTGMYPEYPKDNFLHGRFLFVSG